MSEETRKWLATISFAVLALAALLFALRGFAPEAQAQDVPSDAVCKWDAGWATRFKVGSGPQEFMNEQIAAGRTRFIAPQSTVMCAW